MFNLKKIIYKVFEIVKTFKYIIYFIFIYINIVNKIINIYLS